MVHNERLILIGSSGRNSGKTEFACRLIQEHSKEQNIFAIKVKCICTDTTDCDHLCHKCHVGELSYPGYVISEESDIHSHKDTSRMLKAGASKVFFLQSQKDKLQEGFQELMKQIPENTMIVCESNGIRHFITPALYIIIHNNENEKEKKSYASTVHLADKIVEFQNMSWDFNPKSIHIHNETWIIRHDATAIVLAGGKSTRMKGLDKSMIEIDGIPLIQHIVNQLKPHFDEIIIGANDVQKYVFLNLPVIPDREPAKGPLMGILSCLSASSKQINFITACDIPQMNHFLINKMMQLAPKNEIVMPVSSENYFEPLFAVYSKSIIPHAEQILKTDHRKITRLLEYAKTTLIKEENMQWYYNLNSKDDLQQFILNLPNKNCSIQ